MAAVATMETTTAEGNTRPFPLECLLCPKKPSFSDTSHLLTHISSKAHLHHKFSMEFKAKSEAGVREKLQRYERWYALNEIEHLLSDRLAAKGQRKPTRRGRAVPAGPRLRQSTGAVDSFKEEVDAMSGYLTPNHLPPVGHWNTAPVGHGMDYPGIRDGPYLNGPLYPLALRPRSDYPFPDEVGGIGCDMKQMHFGVGIDAFHGTATPSDMDTSVCMGATDDEAQANKLKGVVWPGMDLFDSATPDQKKKRNQRKDGAAIDQLKVTSEAVTATETVWGPEGDIRKMRDIYATPSVEGTPPSTPPRKRKQRARNGTSSTSTQVAAMKQEDGQDVPPEIKRPGRPSLADRAKSLAEKAKVRQTRAATRATMRENTKKKAGASDATTDVEDAVYSLSDSKPKSSFNVFYEGTSNSPVVDPQTALADDGAGENGFDQTALQPRPALQQLDPNLAITEASTFFKHSGSTRFFDNGPESPHMPFRTQASSYGNSFPGMNGTSLTSLCSQARNGGMFTSFDSPMFNSNGAGDGSNVSFHAANNRRLGFGGFGMDPNSSPFGYNDQREAGLREPNFSDPTFQSAARLFDM